jgi:membrane fusion protein (multidrug efflux system)
MPSPIRTTCIALLLAALALGLGCSKADGHGERSGRPGRGGGPPGGQRAAAAVPVEVASVVRRSISSYIETNGTLEAENEVDLVARVSAPIVELLAEEGMRVRKGQTLARLEQDELRAQLEISKVALSEATTAHERAQELYADNLISEEEFEQAKTDFDAATAQLKAVNIQLDYTEVKAPFSGLIVTRYVDFAQQVSVNTPLFRISDFDPLLCPIQVPERELPKLSVGQGAHLLLEAWPEQRFPARVLRISPVVDAGTGTVKVTLEVDADRRLRPGMFASVFLQIDRREGSLVIPKAALSLESIGDTVYVASDGEASRREVTLGYREGDFVEVASGVDEGESVVVIGHDGLSDGTPIEVLRADGARTEAPARAEPPAGEQERSGPDSGSGRGGRPDFSSMTPEQLERVKERMRERGMTDAQIEERIKAARERAGSAGE